MANIDAAATFPDGLALGGNDDVGIFYGATDPTSGAGEVAPIGSIYIRTTGELWQKTTAPAVGWERLSNNGAGSLSVDDLTDADTTTVVPLLGDKLVWDGTNWIPDSAAQSAGVGGNNYLFAIDTTTQTIVAVNTYQPVTFNNNVFIQTWTHTVGTSIFTAGGDGIYAVTYEFNVQKTAGGNVSASCRALFDGVEVIGSHAAMDITSNNTAFSLSRTFILNSISGQNLVIQYAANNTAATITLAPGPGSPVTPVSATITIRRMT